MGPPAQYRFQLAHPSEQVRAGDRRPVDSLDARRSRSDRKRLLIPVSVEEGIARDLHVGIRGSSRSGTSRGARVASVVASLRKVDWRQVRPTSSCSFLRIPGGGAVHAPPATWVRNPGGIPPGCSELVRPSPTSVIDLTLILETLDGVLTGSVFVIRFMALFTVATGLIVLAGAVMSGRWQRIQEGILLQHPRRNPGHRSEAFWSRSSPRSGCSPASCLNPSPSPPPGPRPIRLRFPDYVLAWRAIIVAVPSVTGSPPSDSSPTGGVATHPPLRF